MVNSVPYSPTDLCCVCTDLSLCASTLWGPNAIFPSQKPPSKVLDAAAQLLSPSPSSRKTPEEKELPSRSAVG